MELCFSFECQLEMCAFVRADVVEEVQVAEKENMVPLAEKSRMEMEKVPILVPAIVSSDVPTAV